MEVAVYHVEECTSEVGTPMALTLTAPRRDAVDGAWRLLFQHVVAYRRLPIEAHAGAHLLALRATYEPRSLPTPATYEVVRSPWLREAVSPYYARPSAIRHFVIVASDLAYDIAAEWCDVQALGDAEPMRAGLQPPQQQGGGDQ
jgi:hypothetical protein